VHQNLPHAPLIRVLVHQNLQHDWWKEGPENEQLAVTEEALQEEDEDEEDEEDDDERVVQNSNSFLLFVVFHREQLFLGVFCSQNGGDDDPQADFSQKFGYKLNMKIEFSQKKHSFIISGYLFVP
jgi:hypothetical protein